MNQPRAIITLAPLAVFAFSLTSLPAQDQLVLLDGSVVRGTVSSFDGECNVKGEGIAEGVIVDGLRRITTPTEVQESGSPITAQMLGGGKLALSAFTIDGEQNCHLHSDVLGEVVLPIDALRAVRLNSDPAEESFTAATAEKNDEDQVFVRLGGGLEPISGLIEKIDNFAVEIDNGSGVRKIGRDTIYGIVFAMVGRAPDHSGKVLVTLADGSTMWGQVDSLADGKFSISTVGNSKVTLPWAKVSGLKVRSTRMVFLSDLSPVEARHQPLVTLKRDWQADKSVAGRPLTLAGKSYEKGIGVASRSVLVFENEGNFDLFAATIGIDSETEGRGDCVFVVEVDGREKYRQRVTGRDPARPVAVEIDGGRRVSLIVETGEDLDLSDHANWCDARLVKE